MRLGSRLPLPSEGDRILTFYSYYFDDFFYFEIRWWSALVSGLISGDLIRYVAYGEL